jgi:aminoglycoside 6'-N-acetyltransferase I
MRRELWPGSEEHASEIAAFFEGSLTEPLAVFSAHDLSGAMIDFAERSIRLEIRGLEQKPTGCVEGVYVIPARRNQAVARTLLQAARKWARDQGCVAFASDRADRVMVDSSF